MAILEIDKMNYTSNAAAQAAYVSDSPANLQVYSEDTIKTEGTHSLKVVADTSSLGKKLTHVLSPVSDLTDVNNVKLDIRSNLTGSNVKVGLWAGASPNGGTVSTDEYDTATGLILHYKMNENAANTFVEDFSASGNDATASSNTSTFTGTGKINSAFDFATNSNYIALTSPIVFGDDATINVWVKDYTTTHMSLAGGNGSGGGVDRLFYLYSDGSVYTGSNTYPEQVNWYIGDKDMAGWHMFTLTKFGQILEFFVDNVSQGAKNLSTIFDIYEIGRGIISGTDYGYAGYVDDFRIYNRILSAKDIGVLFAGTEDSVDQPATKAIHTFTSNGTFTVPTGIEVEVLVVGGGAGGGVGSSSIGNAGGGGAGGVLSNDSLIAHYKCDDTNGTTVIDSVAGRTGTGTYTSADGVIDKAMSLSRTNGDYIAVTSSLFAFGTSAFSFSLWVNALGTISANTIISLGGSNTEGGVMSYYNGNLIFYSGGFIITDPVAFPTNEWVFLTFTSDGTNLKMFKNLVQAGSTYSGAYLSFVSPDLHIGTNKASLTESFDGSMEDVRFYSKCLSQEEMDKIYFDGLPNLVAHYKMNDNAASTTIVDSSVNKLAGVASANTSTLSETGKIDKALSFNGSSEYAAVANNALLQPGTGNFSVAFWLNAQNHGAANGWNGLIDMRPWTTGVDNGWSIGFGTRSDFPDYHKITTHYADGDTGWDMAYDGTQCSSSEVALNTWEHWVVVFDKTNSLLKFYKNEVLETSTLPTGGFPTGSVTPTVPLRIGKDNRNSYIASTLDDLRIYNKALTQAEISLIYNSGVGMEACSVFKMLLASGNYSVVVGDGGTEGNSGEDSSFNGLTAIGGGPGGSYNVLVEGVYSRGYDGGSGGGGAQTSGLDFDDRQGLGVPGQGNDGGGLNYINNYGGFGGGGAGEVGHDPIDVGGFYETGGDGGDGIVSSITGAPTYYAAGGGGSSHGSSYDRSNGGIGGGGRGALPSNYVVGEDGTFYGSGAGAGGEYLAGGTGYQGVVIISYAGVPEVLITEITPNIVVADQFQTVNWDVSAIDNEDKSLVSSIKVEMVNADSANTFYLDNIEIAQAIDIVGMVD